jgi:hypothetical protein
MLTVTGVALGSESVTVNVIRPAATDSRRRTSSMVRVGGTTPPATAMSPVEIGM